MTNTQWKLIQNQIETLLIHLEPFLSFANSHMIDYFSNSGFETHIPNDIKNEIIKTGYEKTLNILLNDGTNPDTPKLNEYVKTTRNLRLYNLKHVCLSRSDLISRLKDWGSKDVSSLKLEVFITEKKSHEVEILGKIAAAISSLNKTTHLIDIGDGRGYLSSMLALHHKIPVLGIDASLKNTDSAVKRAKMLERAWKGIAKNPKQSVPVQNNSVDGTNNLYKQVTYFVTETTDFKQLIKNVFLEDSSQFGLVGLHTCGNLGSNCIKLFNNDDNVKTLCNVSCCYHLLTEEFDKNQEILSQEMYGFPLSKYLRNRKFKLGRNARMLSAQSIDRILYKKELPSKTIFYRAILEVLFKKYKSQVANTQIGRLRKEVNSFTEYVRVILKNIKADLIVTDQDLDNLFESYKECENQLHVFYILRCMLAPVIESLILLDRCLFLHENNHDSALLVQLFDPVISPRCYGLIALK